MPVWFAVVSPGKSKKKSDVTARQKEGYNGGARIKQGSLAMEAVIPKASKGAQQLKGVGRGKEIRTRGCQDTVTVGLCRRILPDLPRLGGTKVEIIGILWCFQALERLGRPWQGCSRIPGAWGRVPSGSWMYPGVSWRCFRDALSFDFIS